MESLRWAGRDLLDQKESDPVASINVLLGPFLGNCFPFVRERLGYRVVVCEVLFGDFRGRAKTACVKVLFWDHRVLIKNRRARVSVRVGAPTRIVRVSFRDQMSPGTFTTLCLFSVWIRGGRIVLEGDLCGQFSRAPYLRDPFDFQIRVFSWFVCNVPCYTWVLQDVSEEYALVRQVYYMCSVHTVGFLFFLWGVATWYYGRHVNEVGLSYSFGSTPAKLRTGFDFEVFVFRFAEGVAKRSLLSQYRAWFPFAICCLFDWSGVFVSPEFERQASVALRVLRPLPNDVSQANWGAADFFVHGPVFRWHIVPCDFRSCYYRERVSEVRDRRVCFTLPAFPVPVNDDVTSHAVVRMCPMFAVSHVASDLLKGQGVFEWIWLVARP